MRHDRVPLAQVFSQVHTEPSFSKQSIIYSAELYTVYKYINQISTTEVDCNKSTQIYTLSMRNINNVQLGFW